MQTIPDYTTPLGKVLLLKVVHKDGRPESVRAPGGFRYPLVPGEEVVAPDWDASPRCGGGIHGWRDGAGDLSASDIHYQTDTTWLVLEADASDVVDLDGKVKVPRARVVALGERSAVCSWLALRVCGPVHYATVTAGDLGTATAGDRGTATAGVGGALVILWWDGTRYRRSCAEVDGVTILPGVPYRLDNTGAFVRADNPKE